MTEDGLKIRPQIIKAYAADLVAQSVNGVFVCGTSGESYSLTNKERKECLEAWMATQVNFITKHLILNILGSEKRKTLCNCTCRMSKH